MNYFDKFLENTDNRKIFKWSQYFEAYEREFNHLRDKDITFLEIGVYKGGSITMWIGFFEKSCIFGLNPIGISHIFNRDRVHLLI